MSTMRRMPAAAATASRPRGLATCSSSARARGLDVERLRAAEEVIGIQVSAHHVSVGDGRARSAPAIAGRAGVGARALGADHEEAAAIDSGDGAAAGGDRRHVEGGHVDLPARDDAFGRLQRRAAFDEGDVGAGAAHVEGHEPAPRVIARQQGARLRAAGRAGEQRVHGAPARHRRGERHDAAVRLHQEAALRADAGLVEALRQMIDVAHEHGLEIRIEERRRHARPFAQSRQHLARDRDVQIGRFLECDAARLLLVRRVHEREQVADRDRADALLFQLANGPPDRVAIEGE